MATTNPITGDLIQTKAKSKEYEKNYEGIDWSVRLEDYVVTTDKPLDNTETGKPDE